MEGRLNRPQEIAKAHEQMGNRSDEVATTLRAASVQGDRNTVRVLNPIVRYLQNALRLDNLDADLMTGKTIRIDGTGGPQVTLPRPSSISSKLSTEERTPTWNCRAANRTSESVRRRVEPLAALQQPRYVAPSAILRDKYPSFVVQSGVEKSTVCVCTIFQKRGSCACHRF